MKGKGRRDRLITDLHAKRHAAAEHGPGEPRYVLRCLSQRRGVF